MKLLLALAMLFAPGGVDAAARCEGKWVVVEVNEPSTSVVVATWGGKSVMVGNRFIPDIGGGNAAGDYDIDITLEVRASTKADAAVLRTGTVHTPNCAPKPAAVTTTTAPPTTTLAAVSAKRVTVAYDPWPAIVEAVRALP